MGQEVWGDKGSGPESEALLAIMDEIKHTPQNPTHVHKASGLLYEHLMTSPEKPDPSFDVTEWNRQWDEVEAEMKRIELADQKADVDLDLL